MGYSRFHTDFVCPLLPPVNQVPIRSRLDSPNMSALEDFIANIGTDTDIPFTKP